MNTNQDPRSTWRPLVALFALAAATSVVVASVAIGVGDTTPAGATDTDRPVIAYSLRLADDEETCELVTVDWATGAVTDLPAAPSADACALDLAVAPDGTVHGFAFETTPLPLDVTPAIVVTSSIGHLVTYAADGTATRVEVVLPEPYTTLTDVPGFEFMGLAIDAAGNVLLMVNGLWADLTDCSAAPFVTDIGAATDTFGMTSCLFGLDPATGLLTLIGGSRLNAETSLGMSIGVDGAWTLVTPLGVGADPVPSVAVDAYWSTVNPTTGEVTITPTTYGISFIGLYDQLRSRREVFSYVMDETALTPEGAVMTATIDPTTGEVTPIANVDDPSIFTVLGVIEGPAPEPVRPSFTG